MLLTLWRPHGLLVRDLDDDRVAVSGWPASMGGSQYVAFALAPIVAANVLAYGWPLLAALWVAATRRSTRALIGASLAGIGFLGVALILLGPAAGTTNPGDGSRQG